MFENDLPLGLGAANLGNLYREMSEATAQGILEAAWERGVRYFDTAPHYGLGLSEVRLGRFLQGMPRDEYVVSTKVGRLLRPRRDGSSKLDSENDFAVDSRLERTWDFTADGIANSLAESLERLGLDRVDLVYLHDPERHDLRTAIDVAIPALAEMRERGAVGAIGVGSMSIDALRMAADSAMIDFLMVAGRYTLADQSILDGVAQSCAENGVGIVSASVFNSGILAGSQSSSQARFDYGTVPAEVAIRVNAIADLCEEFGVELRTAAAQFPLRNALVRMIVVGASRPEQIEDTCARLSVPVPDEFWARLRDVELVRA